MSVKEFADLVESFIALVNGYNQHELLDFLEELNLLFPSLYAGAVKLPEVFDDEEDDAEDREGHDDEESEFELAPETPEEKNRREKRGKEFSELYHKLSEYFGKHDIFTVYFDPYETEGEPVKGTLGDSVADICQDLEQGLRSYKANEIE